MTSIIKFTLKELNTLINDANSCVSKKSVTQNIAFQPWCLSNMKDSVEKILDYKIGKFDKDLDGIILSYKNVKILDDLCAIRQDSSEIYSDVRADMFVFQPRVGATLHGVINKTSVTHLGVLVHRVFNVVIPRPSNEPGNKWIGAQLSVGQKISFEIVVLDLFGALPYIRGCLDENSLPIDDLNNPQTSDETDLVSHVNFAGIKPKAAQTVNSIKKILPKKYMHSDDSDSISDVDEELMQTQTSLIEKIMSLDKCQRASGVKPPFAKNSIGITKIDKTKPAKTSFIDVRNLKTIKSLNKPSENIKAAKDKSEELSILKSKSIVSPAADKKPSRISDDFENISVIAKPPKKRNSIDDSTLVVTSLKKHTSIDESSVIKSPKKAKSLDIKVSKRKTEVNGNQNNNNKSLEVKNTTGDSLVTTSTPFPAILDNAMKNSSQKEYNHVVENINLKKKLSFSNDNVSICSSNDATLDSKEIISKKAKLSKKSKQDSDSFINTNNSQNEDFDTDFSHSSSTSKKLLKKKKKPTSDSYDSTSSIITNTLLKIKSTMDVKKLKHSRKSEGSDQIISITDNSILGSPCDSSLVVKSKKRKRKSSDSSINMSGITSDDMHQSDVSNTVSHRKKRRRNNEPDALPPKNCLNDVYFIPPANVDGKPNGNLSSSEKKRLEHHKSIYTIVAQIQNDPSLLEEIQMFLKARATK